MTWLLQDPHDEPLRGDEIMHVNDLGEPNGKLSSVKSVCSEDRREELFEVVDNFNQILIVTRLTETSWIETRVED